MIKPLIMSISLIWLIAFNSNAQYKVVTDSLKHQQSVQLNAGSQGIGAAYNYGLSRKVALGAGIDFMPVAANNVAHFSDFNSTSNLKAKFTNVHLLADWTPFKNSTWFRLVGGAAYFIKAKGTMEVKPDATYTYGDIVLTPDQVGQVTFSADWRCIAPYLGAGFFRMFPRKRFNVNLDLGTYYLKEPEAHIVGTGTLAGNSSQTAQFQNNIKDYRWLPVLQINFSYKL